MARFGKATFVESLINLGTTRHYRGASFPYTPNVGDTWEQTTPTGLFLEEWYYTGTFWLSKAIYKEEVQTSSSSFSNVGAVVDFPFNNSNYYLLTDFVITYRLNIPSTPTVYWDFILSRQTPTTSANIYTFGNPNAPANTWIVNRIALNSIVDVGANNIQTLRITETRNGNISKQGNTRIEYRKARVG